MAFASIDERRRMMRLALATAMQGRRNAHDASERTMGMHVCRLLLVVAAALPFGACFVTAEQIAANDDAACHSAGLKPGTPAYVKCREDRSNLRFAQNIEAQAMQRQMWWMQQQNTLLM